MHTSLAMYCTGKYSTAAQLSSCVAINTGIDLLGHCEDSSESEANCGVEG
jgi:hypothetical protein